MWENTAPRTVNQGWLFRLAVEADRVLVTSFSHPLITYLIPRSELMHRKDLCRIESFTEHVHSCELPAEHSVGICCLWGAEEAFIITLQSGHKNKTLDYLILRKKDPYSYTTSGRGKGVRNWFFKKSTFVAHQYLRWENGFTKRPKNREKLIHFHKMYPHTAKILVMVVWIVSSWKH